MGRTWWKRWFVAVALAGSLDSPAAVAQDESAEPARSTVELVQRVRPSLVVIHSTDREGQAERGVGSGFVISEDGLIATNLHVIGEGRPFLVELADGSRPRVSGVFATDRSMDLAIIRVETDKPLTPLPLAETPLQIGAPIIAMGNPLGLKHSVVSGVLSGRRTIDGRDMLQLAMPVEPGNSGGPVVDMAGRVHGVVAMKSALSDNLGFAVDVRLLRKLLERPNPITIERWTSIGRLPSQHWQVVFGAEWRRRGGGIHVSGTGEGFGGRSVCLWRHAVPPVPWEVEVEVRLADESGAAGLVFHCDETHRHYGFYPTNGRLRLTCFDGPTVFDWHILQEVATSTYRPGEWNHLRVRREADRFLCYLNGTLLFTSDDKRLTNGQVGLAKFRDTVADFRRFRVQAAAGAEVALADDQEVGQIVDALAQATEVSPDVIQPLIEEPGAARNLRLAAERLEQQARRLRQAEEELHLQHCLRQLGRVTQPQSFDLLRACLWIACLDDPDVDVEAYVEEVARMAGEIRSQLSPMADEQERIAALDKYLFQENGFHGSRQEYYHPANSHIHRVIDDREGLPITLSVLYMELARRLELHVEGVGLPGHFVVRWVPAAGEPHLIDVFDRGRRISTEDAERLVRQAGEETTNVADYLRPATHQEIVERVLRNLLNLAQREDRPATMRRYLEALVQLAPANVQYRGMRALTRYHTGYRRAAVADLDWFLQQQPPGVDLERIRAMRDAFAKEIP